jgi:hypothetical protein
VCSASMKSVDRPAAGKRGLGGRTRVPGDEAPSPGVDPGRGEAPLLLAVEPFVSVERKEGPLPVPIQREQDEPARIAVAERDLDHKARPRVTEEEIEHLRLEPVVHALPREEASVVSQGRPAKEARQLGAEPLDRANQHRLSGASAATMWRLT